MTQKRRPRAAKIRALLTIMLIVLPLIGVTAWRWGAAAQSGVLIPSSLSDKPDAGVLSLAVMNVDVTIDNQHATVKVLQIFDNHVSQVLEGKYLFALPPQASIADFAVWDGDTRIPGVMLERRRAGALYSQIKQQAIDPGLLQQDDEHGGSSAFAAKIFPIPGYGTKRLEMTYTEMLGVEGLTSHFTFPFKASFGDTPQRVGSLNLHIRVISDHPISPVQLNAKSYPLKTIKQEGREYEGEFSAKNIDLLEDFSLDYRIEAAQSTLSWIAYRAPEQISAYDLRDPALAVKNSDGYFQARAIFNQSGDKNGATQATTNKPRNAIVMLDTSLSMHGEKLGRAIEAVDYFLHSLTPEDRFNLILFNRDVAVLAGEALAANAENVERALSFIKESSLGGGTDLKKAFRQTLEQAKSFPPGERSVILISDANPTLGTTQTKNILNTIVRDGALAKDASPIRIFAFGIGGDANNLLLEELARKTRGAYARARETEEILPQLRILLAKVGHPPIEKLTLTTSDQSNFYSVYGDGPDSFDGSSYSFVGRYRRSQPKTGISVTGRYGTEALHLAKDVTLPESDETHGHLPRLWARLRVNSLLAEMNLTGEREDYIAEIIRLSQKYKFVTPYTAFLAAPRALLRPRLIQPGDPVIRLKTDESIKSVFAVLPFGETLPLKFLTTEGVWEGRFFAPAWMPDGTYKCRLLMTDTGGRGYQEEKTFVIDSHSPKIKPNLAKTTVQAGDELLVQAGADRDTARLVARLYGAQPVTLAWSDQEKANVGRLRLPATLAAGRYLLTISAEDFAHNQSSVEVPIEVLGR